MRGAGPSYPPKRDCSRLLADSPQPAMPTPPHTHSPSSPKSSTCTPCTCCSHVTVPATAALLYAFRSNTNDASLRQCITPCPTIKPPLSHACFKKDGHRKSCMQHHSREDVAPSSSTLCTRLLLPRTTPRGSTLVILQQALVKPRPAPPPSPPSLPLPPR